MTLDEFRQLILQKTAIESEASVARHFRQAAKGSADKEDLERYIEEHMPSDRSRSIRAVLSDFPGTSVVSETEVSRAARWCRAEKINVQDTVAGLYITEEDADRLLTFLDQSISVKESFRKAVADFCISDSATEFNRFVNFAKKSGCIYKTINHPFSLDEFFWTGEAARLNGVLDDWIAFCKADQSERKDCYSLSAAGTLCGVDAETLLNWLRQHSDICVLEQGAVCVKKDLLDGIVERWNGVKELMPIVVTMTKPFPNMTKDLAVETSMEAAKKSGLLLEEREYPQQKQNKLYYMSKNENKLCSLIESTIDDIPAVRAFSLPCRKVSALIADGKIPAEYDNAVPYVSRKTHRLITEQLQNYAPLEEIIGGLTSPAASKYRCDLRDDRDKLTAFIEGNGWWSVSHKPSEEVPAIETKFDNVILRSERPELEKRIRLWMQAYKKTDSEKLQMLLESKTYAFPKTCSLLKAYFANKEKVEKSDIDMTDYLLSFMTKEITDMQTEEIISDIVKPFTEASIVSGSALSDFIDSCGLKIKNIQFDATGYHRDVSAYSIKDFAIMVAHVLTPDVWAEKDLIRKAVGNSEYANLWLYTALHVFAAWRGTDFVRLAPPDIGDKDPQRILSEIANDSFPAEDALFIAREFIAKIGFSGMTPHKTERFDNTPPLFFSCPESCLQQFGIILAIATAHYMSSSYQMQFVKAEANTADNILKFYGSDFYEACGKTKFKTIKANKTLLQAIEVVAREDFRLESRVAYHIASIVRAHKGSLKDLSNITEIYLRNSEFYGLTPEYVVLQMMERGVLSFIVEILMKKCYGTQFDSLAIEMKTEVIRELGISPYQIDQMRRLAESAEIAAEDTVKQLMLSKEDCEKALINLAVRDCRCKYENEYCLCTALGTECQYPERQNGIGCQYEILTKSTLIHYLYEYNRLGTDSGTKFEKMRNLAVRDKIVYPKIAEMMTLLEKNTSREELEVYKKIGRRVRSGRTALPDCGDNSGYRLHI